MNATERFDELVNLPEREMPLDEAALLIAAHDHPVDVDRELARLDDLARDAPDTAESLARYLFAERGFVGNTDNYRDPRNSYLDVVLRRRLGIPITLSVLMLETGRRRGMALAGVGMPGHFLVRAEPGLFFDPFHGGVRLDEAGCRERFASTHGDAPFRPGYLAPTGSRAILARMLANLVRAFVGVTPGEAVWALRLRLRIPDLAPVERRDAAGLLGALGRFTEAAAVLDGLEGGEDHEARTVAHEARRLRARAN